MASIGIDTSINASSTLTKASESSNSSLDKDAFLQLLVTEMQYQDPLEPTSNTDYMAQLATFSQVEELQNMSSSISNGQMMSLTGQYVILNVPDSAGNVNQVSGIVDYVTVSEGKTYFHINDNYYDTDYLDSVVSYDYLEHLQKEVSEESNNSATSKDNSETTDAATNN